MQTQLRAIDPLQPLGNFRSFEDLRGKAVSLTRFVALLLGALAALSLILAAAGIYGVISYTVTQRTKEMGIRLALGGSAAALVGSVVSRSALLGMAGVAIGLAGGLGLERLIRSIWVSTALPASSGWLLAGCALLLLVLSAVASLAPALKVVRLDPVRALRLD